MENSYTKGKNFRLPFGEFQAQFDHNADANRSSAATHRATFSTPPPQMGQFVDPRMFLRPGFNSGQNYTLDQLSANSFRQALFESPPFRIAPQTRSFTPASQFPPVGEFQPKPWNVPPPPVNVNVPPPPSVNVNMPPPLPPVNACIPPPGFNPRVLPPPVFNPNCPPPAAASTNTSMLPPHSPLMLPNAPQTSFVNRNPVPITLGQTLGIRRQTAPSFVSSQRTPSNNVNDFDIQYRPSRLSFCGTLSSDCGSSKSPSVPGYVPTSSVDTDFQSVPLSTIAEHSCSSVGGTVVDTATSQSLVAESRRRRASRRSAITFAKFKRLLKEAVVLNDRLRKYAERNLHAEARASDCDYSTLLDSTELRRSDNADTDSKSLSSVVKDSAVLNSADTSTEKRTVRIVPAHEDQCNSLAPTSQSDIDFTPVIDDRESAKIQERLKELRVQIASMLDAVVARQKQTVSKRRRLKCRRRAIFEAECEMLMRRQRRHDEIDKRMNEIQQKQLAAKMELEIKEAADSTLAEVRRKISETNGCMKLIGQLQKLRQLRKDQAERKGVVVRRGADDMFEQRVQALTATLKEQMDLYDAEQRTLQVMLETEQEQTKEKEREREQVRMRERLASYEDRLRTWLFGTETIFGRSKSSKVIVKLADEAKAQLVLMYLVAQVEPLDPMFPYTQYYDLASYSIDTFIKIRNNAEEICNNNLTCGSSDIYLLCVTLPCKTTQVFLSYIRQEWDVYAVSADSETGSRLPPGWVIPTEPTDEVWASALKH